MTGKGTMLIKCQINAKICEKSEKNKTKTHDKKSNIIGHSKSKSLHKNTGKTVEKQEG